MSCKSKFIYMCKYESQLYDVIRDRRETIRKEETYFNFCGSKRPEVKFKLKPA